MKRLICLLLAILICLPMVACSSDEVEMDEDEEIEETEKDEETEDTRETEESEEYKAAVSLLEDGKVKEAYIALYACGDDANAKELMKDFLVLPTEMTSEDETCEYKYEYYDNGALKKEVMYYEGDLSYTHTYVYDDEGRVAEKTVANSGSPKSYVYYEYNGDGKVTKETYDYGSSKSVNEYIYDNSGKLAETRMSGVGGVTYVEVFEYNSEGLLVKASMTDGMSLISEGVYEYDGEGREVKREFKYMRYGYSSTIETEYDEEGRISKETTTTQGNVQEVEYTYNTDGALAVTTYIQNGVEQYREVRFFSTTHGELTSVEQWYPDGTKVKVEDYEGFEYFYLG